MASISAHGCARRLTYGHVLVDLDRIQEIRIKMTLREVKLSNLHAGYYAATGVSSVFARIQWLSSTSTPFFWLSPGCDSEARELASLYAGGE